MRQCRCQSANCKIVWTMGRQKAPGAPAHQATHEIVAADFTIEPFPLPGEYAPGFSYNAEPSQLTPGWGDTRPRGPDAAKVAEIAAAISQRNTERRASWRKENLALSSEDEQRDLLDGNGRVKVASPDTYQNYLTRGFALIGTYRHEINIRAPKEDVDPRSFSNWVVARRPPGKVRNMAGLSPGRHSSHPHHPLRLHRRGYRDAQ